MELEIGEQYHRRDELAAQGGVWMSGIITTDENPNVFIITGGYGEDEYGYNDRILEDGTFYYFGQGSEGDMDWRKVNRAVRDHKQMGKPLHAFEKSDESYMVTYIGEYEYVDHTWQRIPDDDGNMRDGIQFELVPVGGTEISVEDDPDEMPLDELYDEAVQSAPRPDSTSRSSSSDGSTGGDEYSRAEVVRSFALRVADGTCQGCGEDAPFIDENGEPYLEVHHMHRLADKGPDHPDNVIALCPNCHRRVHHGRDGEEYNQQLIEVVRKQNQNLGQQSSST
jgi:5-methylcytosine-specific restriction protein A